MSFTEKEKTQKQEKKVLIQRKLVDVSFGMLPGHIIRNVVRQFPIMSKEYAVLPFVNINKKAVAINRRSETARKAIVLASPYNDSERKAYLLKEIPWYCSYESHVIYEMELQDALIKKGRPLPKIYKTKNGKLFYTFGVDDEYFDKKTKYCFMQDYVVDGSSWKGLPEQNISAARHLALLHKACKEIYDEKWKNNKKFAKSNERDHVILFNLARGLMSIANNVCKEKADRLEKTCVQDLLDLYSKCMQKLDECQKNAQHNGYGNLVHPVHGDYCQWNMIFDPKTNEVKAHIDFDSSAIDDPIHDIAEMILHFCFFIYRDQVTRFTEEAPMKFNLQEAKRLFMEYCKHNNDRPLEQHLILLKDALISIVIEFHALGLIRGDYSMKLSNDLWKSVEYIEGEAVKLEKEIRLDLEKQKTSILVTQVGFLSTIPETKDDQKGNDKDYSINTESHVTDKIQLSGK